MVLQLWFVLRLFNGLFNGFFNCGSAVVFFNCGFIQLCFNCDFNCEYLKCVKQRVICVMHCASSERLQDCADQLRRSNWYVLLS